MGGLLLGSGCLFLARHRASLGGATTLSLYLQEKHGFRAGKAQMAIDSVVVLLALLVVPPQPPALRSPPSRCAKLTWINSLQPLSIKGC